MTEPLGVERARTLEVVRRGFSLPDLTGVASIAIVTDAVETDIAATYFDTADLRLTARQITLRRTPTGGRLTWDLRMEADDGSATEVDAGRDARLERGPLDAGAALVGNGLGRAHAARSRALRIASSSPKKISLSSVVPIETRKQSPIPKAGAPQWRT